MGQLETFDEILARTLDDGRMSRGEKRALQQVLEDWKLDADQVAVLRSRAFDAARSAGAGGGVLDWLEEVVKAIDAAVPTASANPGEAWFSPGEDCRERILDLVRSTRQRLDICVFTITDNLITDAVLEARRRKVEVRIVTDDQKSYDRGSDVEELARAGIPVAVDTSDKHMHHKFAIFDERTLLTGSYNWTRSAFTSNEENIVVITDDPLIESFSQEFERLWNRFSG